MYRAALVVSLVSTARLWNHYGPDSLSDSVVRRTDFDVTIRQYVVSGRDLACAILIVHKTVSDDEVKVCLLP